MNGHVVATWSLNGTTLTVKPLERGERHGVVKALHADAADVVRFLGLPDETDGRRRSGLIGRGLIDRGYDGGAKPWRTVFSVTTRGSTNCSR